MQSAGPVIIATRLRGLTAQKRAQVAFARLREANIKPERLLAIHIAMTALIEDDPGSHRSKEFLRVQSAKAIHRLASGYHRAWEMTNPQGGVRRIELHKWPRSSGRVLRYIGSAIEKECELVCEKHLTGVLALKARRYGVHPALARSAARSPGRSAAG
jgi:hypothetical protein